MTGKIVCEYRSILVLVGIGLVQWQCWWKAASDVALPIVPYVALEAVEAGRDAWNVDPSECGKKNK